MQLITEKQWALIIIHFISNGRTFSYEYLQKVPGSYIFISRIYTPSENHEF